MESILFTAICVILIISLVTSVVVHSKKQSNLNLPPGPWKLPIIGNLHQLLGSLPHHRMRDLSKIYGPDLMHLKLGEISMVVASSAVAAREILKTHDIDFASRPMLSSMEVLSYGGKGMTISPYGEYWRQLRKICTMELLSAKRVSSFRSTREEEVCRLVQSISSSCAQKNNMVNLSKLLPLTINSIVSSAVTGCRKNKDHQTAFLETTRELLQLISGFHLVDLFPSLTWLLGFLTRSKRNVYRVHHKMDGILQDVIEEHDNIKGKSDEQISQDFVDVLLRLKAEGDLQFNLTIDDIKAITLEMLLAASDTSSSVVVWAMTELMRNPSAMIKAQSELRAALKGKSIIEESDISKLSYLQLVIKETLRLHPPVPLLVPRECRKSNEILGYKIQKNTRVVVNVWAMGRDPSYWDDAEDFKPERFEGNAADIKGERFEYLPFGAGRRSCPGSLFGTRNLELALASLLYHFEWRLPEGVEPKNLDMTEEFGGTVQKKLDLCLFASLVDQSILTI